MTPPLAFFGEPRTATWFRPTLPPEEQAVVLADRDQHPNPVVQRKTLVLWAVHLGHSRQHAADLASVGIATATLMQHYVALDEQAVTDDVFEKMNGERKG